jgi:hypothetical protein
MSSAYVAGVFGLVGALLGGLIAGLTSLKLAREATTASARAWIRDSRRGVYDRFLSSGQRLLIGCETLKDITGPEMEGSVRESVGKAYMEFFEAYGVVQTVAQPSVVDAAMEYAYRLQDLAGGLKPTSGAVATNDFDTVAKLVRDSRHKTINAMRRDLELERPDLTWADDYNPFTGIKELQDKWKGQPAPLDRYPGGFSGPGGAA